MNCLACKGSNTEVIDSRPSKEHKNGIRRRRQCLDCYSRFSTIELYEVSSLEGTILAQKIKEKVRNVKSERRRKHVRCCSCRYTTKRVRRPDGGYGLCKCGDKLNLHKKGRPKKEAMA